MPTLHIDFHDPKAASFKTYQAGFAGLWLTLKYLDQTEKIKPLEWALNEAKETIQLQWTKTSLDVFQWLFEKSFKISENGWLLPAIWDNNVIHPDTQFHFQKIILNTFYQHNSSRTLGDNEEYWITKNSINIKYTYRKVINIKPQEMAPAFCDKKGELKNEEIEVKGWLNPGGVVCHASLVKYTVLTAPPKIVLPLLYAPFLCHYFKIKSELEGSKILYAVVVPKVNNVQTLTAIQEKMWTTQQDTHATGLEDAGFKYFKAQRDAGFKQPPIQNCDIIAYGERIWAKPQYVKTNSLEMTYNENLQKQFEQCLEQLPDRIRLQNKNPEQGFISPSLAREIIVPELLKKEPFYCKLGKWLNKNDIYKKLLYESKGMKKMIENCDDIEILFIKACHESILSLGRNQDLIELFHLKRCINSKRMQEFLLKLWSKGKQKPTLKEHWEILMKFAMNKQNWKRCYNLTYLAFITCPPRQYPRGKNP